MLELTSEGADLVKASGVKMEDTVFTIRNYSKQVVVTKNAIEDNQYTIAQRDVKALARSTISTKDNSAFSVLAKGFSGVATAAYPFSKMGGGEKLFSIAHAMGNGGTQSNVLVNSEPLTYSSLSKARELLISMKTHDGAGYYPSSGRFIVVVANANSTNANTIVKSINVPGGNNNDINLNTDISVLVVPQL